MLETNSQTSECKKLKSFNNLVRPRQHIRRNCQADLLGGFQIDYEFKLLRLLEGELGRLSHALVKESRATSRSPLHLFCVLCAFCG